MSLGPRPYMVRADVRARMPCECAIVMLAVLVPQKQRSLLAFSQKIHPQRNDMSYYYAKSTTKDKLLNDLRNHLLPVQDEIDKLFHFLAAADG